MKRSDWVQGIVWIVGFQAIGAVMGLLTRDNIQPWYMGLQKSALTPPPWVFSVVWPLLYAMLAVVALMIYRRRHMPEYRTLKYCFILQLVMNWLWTPIFFHWHLLGFSLAWIILISLLVLACLLLAFHRERLIGWLLLPYFLWLCFASYLNLVIWLVNP